VTVIHSSIQDSISFRTHDVRLIPRRSPPRTAGPALSPSPGRAAPACRPSLLVDLRILSDVIGHVLLLLATHTARPTEADSERYEEDKRLKHGWVPRSERLSKVAIDEAKSRHVGAKRLVDKERRHEIGLSTAGLTDSKRY